MSDEAMPVERVEPSMEEWTEGSGHGAVEVAEGSAPTPDTPHPTAEPQTEPEPDPNEPAHDIADHLLDVNVRFWAELGRSKLPLAEAVALGTGAIVDLDKEPDEQLDVYVNGTIFAKGRLLLVDGEWAVHLEQIMANPGHVEQPSSAGSEA